MISTQTPGVNKSYTIGCKLSNIACHIGTATQGRQTASPEYARPPATRRSEGGKRFAYAGRRQRAGTIE